MNIGINGFGRIGRLVLRNALSRPNINVVAINDLYPTDYLAYLLKYDSSHGRLNQKIRFDKNHLFIGEKKIAVSSKKNPSEINWKNPKADYIIESTGLFVTRNLAQQHLTSGAKKVILSCPSKEDIPMYVMGVNHQDYKKEEDIVSNASCTTNCLAPIVEVLNRNFGIKSGVMSTVHAATATQKTVDGPSLNNWRSGRGFSQNIIPSTTGAAKAVGRVLPSLKGKLTSNAIRVPVPNGSLAILNLQLRTKVSKDRINSILKKYALEGELVEQIKYSLDNELVSSDIIGSTAPSIFDSKATITSEETIVIYVWYDNEYGYSHQVMRLAKHMAKVRRFTYY